MATANVKLSAHEQALVINREWLLMKRDIMEKAAEIMAFFREKMDAHQRLAAAIGSYGLASGMPKISRGENYRGFPYVVLDHPRVFGRQDVFSIRCLFWWGHHFLLSFHMEGAYRETFLRRLHNKQAPESGDWHLCVHDDPWQHYFAEDNFIAVKEKSMDEWLSLLMQKRFVKAAAKTDVSGWNDAPEWLDARLNELADWLD